jgi:hypothetical protein
MTVSEKDFRDIYLVVTHYQRPAPGEKTHLKDWKKNGKWQVFEEATVTDNLKDKLTSSASVVINVTKSKVEKNRFRNEEKGDDMSIFISYMQKFQEHIVKFYIKFRPEILDELIAQKKQEELNKKIKEMGEEQTKITEAKKEETNTSIDSTENKQ